MHSNSAEIPPDATYVHIHTEAVMADVTVIPGRAGKILARIRLSHEDSTELTAQYVTIAFDPGIPGQNTLQRDAFLAPDGTWSAEFVIPQAGIWTVRVMVTAGTGAPIVLDAPIVIMQCSNKC